MNMRTIKTNTIHMTHLILFVLLFTSGCKNSTEFDPGPFARDNEDSQTLLTFKVTNTTGQPIENAYVVSYRSLAPKYIRVGVSCTNNQGENPPEDKSNTAKGYATVVTPCYNSIRVPAALVQKQENEI